MCRWPALSHGSAAAPTAGGRSRRRGPTPSTARRVWSTKTATQPVRCSSDSTRWPTTLSLARSSSRQLADPIATDLADELGVQTAASRPHGDVGGAAARRQHHLAERVAARQQLAVGADQHVPGEVADDAQGRRHSGHGSRVARLAGRVESTGAAIRPGRRSRQAYRAHLPQRRQCGRAFGLPQTDVERQLLGTSHERPIRCWLSAVDIGTMWPCTSSTGISTTGHHRFCRIWPAAASDGDSGGRAAPPPTPAS